MYSCCAIWRSVALRLKALSTMRSRCVSSSSTRTPAAASRSRTRSAKCVRAPTVARAASSRDTTGPASAMRRTWSSGSARARAVASANCARSGSPSCTSSSASTSHASIIDAGSRHGVAPSSTDASAPRAMPSRRSCTAAIARSTSTSPVSPSAPSMSVMKRSRSVGSPSRSKAWTAKGAIMAYQCGGSGRSSRGVRVSRSRTAASRGSADRSASSSPRIPCRPRAIAVSPPSAITRAAVCRVCASSMVCMPS